MAREVHLFSQAFFLLNLEREHVCLGIDIWKQVDACIWARL